LEGLGRDVVLGHPAALDDPSFTPRFMAMWATNMALGIKTMESWIGREMTAADIEPVNWAQAQWAKSVSGVEYGSATLASPGARCSAGGPKAGTF
jgi:amidase